MSYTLAQLSEKVGYGVGNLSSYETGKLQPRDPTILRILTLGYEYSKKMAQAKLSYWRIQEVSDKYFNGSQLKLAQSEDDAGPLSPLDFYLQEEGLDEKEILDIKNRIAFYKHKKRNAK